MKIQNLILPLCALFLSFGFPAPNKKTARIEIYLMPAVSDTMLPENPYFEPSQKEMIKPAFIGNDEILGYRITPDTAAEFNHGYLYVIQLSKSGQKKLQNMDPVSMCCGQKFAITVNKKPIVGGYFWNPLSTSSCNWMTATQNAEGNLVLERGYPYNYYNPQIADGRENKLLLNAFAKSGRLFRQ